MAMDINNGLGPLAQGGNSKANRTADGEAKAARGSQNSAQSAEDRVEISADAANLRSVAAGLESQESFDEARVAAIKTAIENGQYPIDSRRLAESFLQLESQIYQ